MKELFIPYTEALALKELGFDGKCLAAYTNRGKFHQTSSDYWDNDSIKMIKEYTTIKLKVLAPLYTQAFKWFRDTHNLDAWVEEINHGINNDKKQYIFQLPTKTSHFEKIKYFETYEQAELECLRELIEIVKEQKK